MATFDAVFVGSGINSLVGAALLAREGWSVCVLERNDVAGGCIRTSTDLTLPGFTHERHRQILRRMKLLPVPFHGELPKAAGQCRQR